jgi:hypothetical protein
MPVQAAEIALRRALGLAGRNDVRLAVHSVEDDVTSATFVGPGEQAYLVRVRSTLTEPVTLTCRATRDQPARAHRVLGIDPA